MTTRSLLAAALGLLWATLPAVGPAAAADATPPAAKAPAAEKAEPGTGAAETPKAVPLGRPDKPASLNLGSPEYCTNKLIWNTLAAALVVLVLGGIVLFFMKRVMPRIGIGHGKKVAILETTYLGPQRTVHLLQVGARCLLVGATRESVRLVADVTDAFGQDPETAQPKKRFVIPGETGAP
jgi:hypothetical protein